MTETPWFLNQSCWSVSLKGEESRGFCEIHTGPWDYQCADCREGIMSSVVVDVIMDAMRAGFDREMILYELDMVESLIEDENRHSTRPGDTLR